MSEAYPRKYRNLAFRLWCENNRNMTKVREIMHDEYGIRVGVPAISRWRDTEDWEAKLMLKQNQFKRMLRASDDPILREMAIDDVTVMKLLGIMTRLVTEQLNRRATRQLFAPRNARELMQMIEFITGTQQRILGAQQEKEVPSSTGRTTNITIDNRRLVLRDRLAAVPQAQRRMVIDQMRGATRDEKALAVVREEVWDAEDSSA